MLRASGYIHCPHSWSHSKKRENLITVSHNGVQHKYRHKFSMLHLPYWREQLYLWEQLEQYHRWPCELVRPSKAGPYEPQQPAKQRQH